MNKIKLTDRTNLTLAYIGIIIFIFVLSISILLLSITNFPITGILISIAILLLIGVSVLSVIETDQYVQTLLFNIYTYNAYNKETMLYDTKFYIDTKREYAKFILGKFIKTYTKEKSIKEINNYIEYNHKNYYISNDIFNTKEEVMQQLINIVKEIINNKKCNSTDNELIQNVILSNSYTVEDIIKIINT